MDACTPSNDCTLAFKKRKLDEKELSETFVKNELSKAAAYKSSEKVPTCVPILVKQVKEEAEKLDEKELSETFVKNEVSEVAAYKSSEKVPTCVPHLVKKVKEEAEEKLDEKELSETFVNNEISEAAAYKSSEKVPTCVHHLVKHVKEEAEEIAIARGKSVNDIKKEAEQRKLLLLGFVPAQGKSSVLEPTSHETYSPSVTQHSRPKARLYLPSKPSSALALSIPQAGPGSSQGWQRAFTYLIDRTQVGPGSVFDSHCHLDMVYHRLKTEGGEVVSGLMGSLQRDGEGLGDKFGGCVTNFCDPREWSRGNDGFKVSAAVVAADIEDKVYLSIGCHPHFADRMTPGRLCQLDRLVRGDGDIQLSVVAIGECGLDYSAKNKVDKELQKKVFYDQLILGLKYNLPIVLHIRDAEEDGYSVLAQAGVPSDWSIHRHCFTGDWASASTWLERFPSSKIGITGCVTFSRATQVHETVRNMSLDRLLLETDAPYFLPTGVDKRQYQYTFSQPGQVIHVAAKVAELKGVALEEILIANRRNVTDVYGIKFNL